MGGAETFAPLVNTGRMDVAIASETDVRFAFDGKVAFEGRPLKDLRAIAALYSFQVGFFVKKDSPIKTVRDLKGKKVPITFANQKSAHRHYLAVLAAHEMTENDLDGVKVPNVIRAAQDFAQGKTVASFFALGAGKVTEVSAQVGGIRFLSIDDSPEAIARIRKIAPGAYITVVEPRPGLTGILSSTKVLTENYMLFGGKHASDDVVYKFVKTLYEEKTRLSEAFARWKRYSTKKMAKDMKPIVYHPGAIKFYKEQGMWPPKSNF